MYFNLSNTDALHDYGNEFIINIQGALHLSREIGLCEIHTELTEVVTCFDLWCELCDTSIVGGHASAVPILRRIHTDRQLNYLIFDPIRLHTSDQSSD